MPIAIDLRLLADQAHPLEKNGDMRGLIDHIHGARIVMIGEASHGTHEYYSWRDRLTRELIENYGYNFIAVEGDWPPCYQVNEFINSDRHFPSQAALKVFRRWPTWMWANTDVAKALDWLKSWNSDQTDDNQIGFYGLDIYSLFESIDEVVRQVDRIDPRLTAKVRTLYGCFEPHMRDEKRYLRSLLNMTSNCEDAARQALLSLNEIRIKKMSNTNSSLFSAIQNATIIKNAERYYRSMVFVDDQSWNIRERHMMDTLDSLLEFYGPKSKAIVWAHNTHVGDYRATNMVDFGNVNIGGLAREKYGEHEVALVGFGSYRGQVTASGAWGGTTQEMRVPAALPNSYEDLLHRVSGETPYDQLYFLLNKKMGGLLSERRGHRAIGVVYSPLNDRSNYVPTVLSQRYDAFVYIDTTTALSPLTTRLHRDELPETYPSGM